MRRRLLPSLTALRSFEAVARVMSFSDAAAELNVTQSAASRQVRSLELFLGLPLLLRGKRGLELTDEGRSYAATVKDALDAVELATLQVMAPARSGEMLTLSALPTFATRWLIPRLASFTSGHPSIAINIISNDGPVTLDPRGREVALRFGRAGDWPDATTYRLGIAEEMVVVASPALVAGLPAIASPEMLRGHALLQHSTRPGAWTKWLVAAGMGDLDPGGTSFEHFFMLIRAAEAGLGFALLPRFLIEDELRAGRLVVPWPMSTIYDGGYYLICARGTAALPKIRAFRDWLLAESGAEPA